MFDIDPQAYRVLLQLKRAGNSRFFKPSKVYWLTYLINRGLAKSEVIENEEHEKLGVAVITPKGLSLIKDKNKEAFKAWAFRIIPIVISVIALIIAILK